MKSVIKNDFLGGLHRNFIAANFLRGKLKQVYVKRNI